MPADSVVCVAVVSVRTVGFLRAKAKRKPITVSGVLVAYATPVRRPRTVTVTATSSRLVETVSSVLVPVARGTADGLPGRLADGIAFWMISFAAGG
jgi:hypothetical protein